MPKPKGLSPANQIEDYHFFLTKLEEVGLEQPRPVEAQTRKVSYGQKTKATSERGLRVGGAGFKSAYRL